MAAIVTRRPFQPIFLSALLCFFLSLLLTSPGCKAEQSILYSNIAFRGGDSIRNGNFRLTLLANCNLVLYRLNTVIWQTSTQGQGQNCYLVLQADANLVIYEPNRPADRVIWATNAWRRGSDKYVLVLQDNGNLVIYGGVVWSTGTSVGVSNLVHQGNLISDEPRANLSTS